MQAHADAIEAGVTDEALAAWVKDERKKNKLLKKEQKAKGKAKKAKSGSCPLCEQDYTKGWVRKCSDCNTCYNCQHLDDCSKNWEENPEEFCPTCNGEVDEKEKEVLCDECGSCCWHQDKCPNLSEEQFCPRCIEPYTDDEGVHHDGEDKHSNCPECGVCEDCEHLSDCSKFRL